MSGTVDTIRGETVTRLLTLVPATLARQSEEPYYFIRQAAHSPVHLEFAVGVASTAPLNPDTRRQRPSDGEHVETDVSVGFFFQLDRKKPDSETDLLTAEATVRNTLVAVGWTSNLGLIWTGSTRTDHIDGWMWVNQTFRAIHRLPLS